MSLGHISYWVLPRKFGVDADARLLHVARALWGSCLLELHHLCTPDCLKRHGLSSGPCSSSGLLFGLQPKPLYPEARILPPALLPFGMGTELRVI